MLSGNTLHHNGTPPNTISKYQMLNTKQVTVVATAANMRLGIKIEMNWPIAKLKPAP